MGLAVKQISLLIMIDASRQVLFSSGSLSNSARIVPLVTSMLRHSVSLTNEKPVHIEVCATFCPDFSVVPFLLCTCQHAQGSRETACVVLLTLKTRSCTHLAPLKDATRCLASCSHIRKTFCASTMENQYYVTCYFARKNLWLLEDWICVDS